MTRRLSTLLIAGLLAASGCGNGTLSEEAAADLEQSAAAVRAAAETRDIDAAEQELAALRAALDAHVEADAVSAARAREITAAADAVEARLPLLVEEEAEPPEDQAPPTTAPPTTEPPTTEPPTTEPPTTEPSPEPDDDEDGGDGGDDGEDDGEEDGGGDGRGPDGEGPPGQSGPDDGE